MAQPGASPHARRHASVRTQPDPAGRGLRPTGPRRRLMATPSGHALRRARPIPAAPRQRRLYRPCAMVLLSQRDLPTCGASPGSTRAVGPHRARLVTTPRQFEPALSLGTLDDATFAADAAPAASADDVVRRSLACEAVPTWCRSVSTLAIASPEGWYSDHGGSPPPTRRTRTTSSTAGSTTCRFSTTPACDCGWIPTPPARTGRNAVACDGGDGRMTGAPRRLDTDISRPR